MQKTEHENGYASYLFCQGNNSYAYDLFGAHLEMTVDGSYRYTFRVWAPRADKIYVIGDFNDWDESLPMDKNPASGIWSATLVCEHSLENSRYQYKVVSPSGIRRKSDPYARCFASDGDKASILCHEEHFEWRDESFLEKKAALFAQKGKKTSHFYSAPLNIYEMHLASWQKNDGKTEDQAISYREIADALAPYLAKMHYTHVELLPVTEYSSDDARGYRTLGYFAPTSRFGMPMDFKYFVRKMHENGIGVIMDWIPAYFPKDEQGLFEFDGSPLYEYQGKDRMENKTWGVRYFDVARPEVQSFLISSALYWLREFHMDGLRVSAITPMLYLDYDREPGEWYPNVYGNNHNLESIAFFKKLNSTLFAEFPHTLMIAEESTSWPMITKPAYEGGLGFNFKWNTGFSNDMFEYVSEDPVKRQFCHNKLTFPMMYAFAENYILPVSHDGVGQGKKSLVDKMFGTYDEKFAAMRAFMTFMMTHPGKKLLFMGTEFAPFREWDAESPLEWFMLDYPRHTEMRRCIQKLNELYQNESALHEIDDGWDGFAWIEPNDKHRNTISYRRISIDGQELLVVINFSPIAWENYVLPVPKRGEYEEIFTTDAQIYGGSGLTNGTVCSKQYKETGKMKSEIALTVPAYGGLILRRRGIQKRKTTK